MNDNLLIDINQYPGAAMYAKLHNISFKQLVESFLMKFQTSPVVEDLLDAEGCLDSIDEKLMKQTFDTAHQDYLAGRCVPNSQVLDYIKGELGWKFPMQSLLV